MTLYRRCSEALTCCTRQRLLYCCAAQRGRKGGNHFETVDARVRLNWLWSCSPRSASTNDCGQSIEHLNKQLSQSQAVQSKEDLGKRLGDHQAELALLQASKPRPNELREGENRGGDARSRVGGGGVPMGASYGPRHGWSDGLIFFCGVHAQARPQGGRDDI